jgi:hypothetical protein
MSAEKPFGLTGQPEVPLQFARRNYEQPLQTGGRSRWAARGYSRSLGPY